MHPSPRRSILRRLVDLPEGEWRLLVEAWWRLAQAALCLRFAPQRAVRAALTPPPPSGKHARAQAGAKEVGRAVARAAAHHLRPMTCLPRALALRQMLARRNVAAVVRIGVRKAEGAVAAHAWVEVGGVPVGEPEPVEERFLPLVAPRQEPH